MLSTLIYVVNLIIMSKLWRSFTPMSKNILFTLFTKNHGEKILHLKFYSILFLFVLLKIDGLIRKYFHIFVGFRSCKRHY